MLKKTSFLFIFSILIACNDNPDKNISELTGYWEIQQVEKNNTKLKDYTVNTTIDYFEINDTIGFRKKVVPQFDGKYLISQHKSPFVLKVGNDSLNIYYTSDDTFFKETIVKLTKKELIISNTEGFKYTYKPFEALNLEL
ncbi:hypothetical protein D7030_10285 [Flavobacteriaceae bacterium AU392]|nr:hypothetical protein D1817_06525 [Flavobacteriaceae bacterium]RKM83675.1 hypothetical protein D7030_10285 [Flavobacteriaceae bacterium AU392]